MVSSHQYSSQLWDTLAEDFGQKVDLTVRIREILRNYPEGLSILKELIQNADDAGARTVRLCTAEARGHYHPGDATDIKTNSSNEMSPISTLQCCPSLLAYNSAKFTSSDFKSIQQIGNSLKKSETGTKTGRFGVGVNSTYHLTDVPMFASGTKVVLFDPQAKYIPNINPANPGKMMDCSTNQGKRLVESLPELFSQMKIWDNTMDGHDFDGTLFRFALRTKEQAQTSKLSNQSHTLEHMTELLQEMSKVASTMLIFLKHVETIELYHWGAKDLNPKLTHRTRISNVTEKLRQKRAFMLSHSNNSESTKSTLSKPIAIDYFMDIENSGNGVVEQGEEKKQKITQIKEGTSMSYEKWVICNQYGGGNASIMAKDPSLAHMKLIPWAGVAARLNPIVEVDEGKAYCFLPLPVKTLLPVHVNGYFELSSNRRDVWWGDDMAGDGRARASWNQSIVADIAAPCYCRLVVGSIRSKHISPDTYEKLFPQKNQTGPWEILSEQFYLGIRNYPVLYSQSLSEWVSPSIAILMEKKDHSKEDKGNKILEEILKKEKVPLVLFQRSELRNTLLDRGVCSRTSTPAFFREHFSNRKKTNGALEDEEHKFKHAEHILNHCISDLTPLQYGQLSGCQLIPLADGNLGTFYMLPQVNQKHLKNLMDMGYTILNCKHALRKHNGNFDKAIDFLFSDQYDASSVVPRIDSYLICTGDEVNLLKRAQGTFLNLDQIVDNRLKKFFLSENLMKTMNLQIFSAELIPDLVTRAIPKEWRNVDSAYWIPESTDTSVPNHEWFQKFWRYVFMNMGSSIKSIAEKNCIVPTNEGIVCNLSAGSSVLDSSGLEKNIVEACVSLGVRTFLSDTLPVDLVVPKQVWSYVHRGTREGLIKSIETSIRRSMKGKNMSPFDEISEQTKISMYKFFTNEKNGPISPSCYDSLRTFPIFQCYSDNHSETIKFVSLNTSKKWFLLDSNSFVDEKLMTSEFLAYNKNNQAEIKLLVSLGVNQINRSDFFRNFLIPRLPDFDEQNRNHAIKSLVQYLPSIYDTDPEFYKMLGDIKFIPSSMTQTLKAVKDLYDPEIAELQALMDDDSFPHESFWTQNLLLNLRNLGLQTTLTWDVILECAQSIQDEAENYPADNLGAKNRGKELLTFLDVNWKSFFPELAPKEKKSSARRFFSKVNAVLFDDPEKKQNEAVLHAKRVQSLFKIKWVPVCTEPESPILPWHNEYEVMSVGAPLEVTMKENMWFSSFTKRLLDGEIKSIELINLFGWSDQITFMDLAIQLRSISEKFGDFKLSLTKDDGNQAINIDLISQKLSAELPRIYHLLNQVQSDNDVNRVRSILHGRKWLWMGGKFVSSDYVSYSSSINASPYLHTIPPDLVCFKNLLDIFGVRSIFGTSDYCDVLQRMSKEKDPTSKTKLEIAVNCCNFISDDAMKLKQMEVFAPSTEGSFMITSTMVYDDAPWLSKSLQGNKRFNFIHSKISNVVAEKIGAKSLRRLLLEDNSDVMDFGDGVLHESFGQSESLTRRLKNIVEMYPEGLQQLSELVQNADDANASIVRFVISKKSHGTKSLLGQKLSFWQGPALLVYNDSTFSPTDFQNLSKIGQASKMERLITTGRFGLGFNSVFHWTDVPSFVSGDHLVFFDPHEKYVPGTTSTSRGIKIRFSGTDLINQFPDQLNPYCLFGNNMANRFDGTLFRFPFRNDHTARESEISSKQCNDNNAIDNLVEQFKSVIPKFLLFLRHVKKIEVYVEESDEETPRLLYYADVTDRKNVIDPNHSQREPRRTNIEQLKNSIVSNSIFKFLSYEPSSDWNSIPKFIMGSQAHPLSKEAFYNKLEQTPADDLPRTQHIVTIKFEDRSDQTSDVTQSIDETQITTLNVINQSNHRNDEGFEVQENVIESNKLDLEDNKILQESASKINIDNYLVVSALGGGNCRKIACDSSYRHMKFIPWGGVAAHLKRDGNMVHDLVGNAFCFLPLPAETGLPVHINGYFELSANRRDIWFGNDMVGDGKIRSNWNRALLNDVIAPLYIELLRSASKLVGPGKYYDQLWPIQVNGEVWKNVRDAVYRNCQNLPLLYSAVNGGKWLSPNSAFIICTSESTSSNNERQDNEKKVLRLRSILLKENLNIVSIPTQLCETLREQNCRHTEVSPEMVRSWFKERTHHPSLGTLSNNLFLLKYCTEDIVKNGNFHELNGLPFIPLCNGGFGIFGQKPQGPSTYFTVTASEREILSNACEYFVNTWTQEDDINSLLQNPDLQAQVGIIPLRTKEFISLLSLVYPTEWKNMSKVRWSKSKAEDESLQITNDWISKLWKYIAEKNNESNSNINSFVNTWQILPAFIGQNEKILLKIEPSMAVVSPSESSTVARSIPQKISSTIQEIGIAVVDVDLLGLARTSLLHNLDGFVQPPTLGGIIQAFINSFPSNIDDENLIKIIGNRFNHISNERKIGLREYLRDQRQMESIKLRPEQIKFIRFMPIFPVYKTSKDEADTGVIELADISIERFLPPSFVDCSLLDSKFVDVPTTSDKEFLLYLGIKKMEITRFYESHIIPLIIKTSSHSLRKSAILSFLLNLPTTLQEIDEPNEWLARISNYSFIPNRNEEIMRPKDLYDPDSNELSYLLDDSMIPSEEFTDPRALSSLRYLGLRTKLSCDGVLESARRIEAASLLEQGLSNPGNGIAIKRSHALIKYLDNDETIKALLNECRQKDNNDASISEEFDHSSLSFALNCNEGRFISELNEIAWLPKELIDENKNKALNPPKGVIANISVGRPRNMRPKPDEWLCSHSMDTLSVSIRSQYLFRIFGWDNPIPAKIIALQLIALAKAWDDCAHANAFQQVLATIIPRCYELLNNHLDTATVDEKESILLLLSDKPWVWVGDCFVTTSQVAFDAPEKARPYLFSLPQESLCFGALFKCCGVRDTFDANDYAKLTVEMSVKLNGCKANDRQIDLAIGMAKLLSRVPLEELSNVNMNQIFLPSRERKMYRANQMIYDDAPWLSSLVTAHIKRSKHYVHEDLNNEIARILGAKSLREVLSASQNGMVKIPCPEQKALSQLFSERNVEGSRSNIEDCKVLLEMLELAEMNCVKQVSFLVDYRSHQSESLLNPMLSHAQGPSIVICFHNVVMKVDDLIKSSSPSRYYSESVGGRGGCGGKGFTRYGRGLSSCFYLTDIVQVLCGNQLIMFDPTGEYFLDGNVDVNSGKLISQPEANNAGNITNEGYSRTSRVPTARNYGISIDFINQFPDQFGPFLSLQYGVRDSFFASSELSPNNSKSTNGAAFCGTIFRLPIRTSESPGSRICERVFDMDALSSMIKTFKEKVPSSFIFTYNLQHIRLDEWNEESDKPNTMLQSRVSSSPITRRNHHDEMVKNKVWMKNNTKITKLFKSSWIPLQSTYTLQISSCENNDGAEIHDTFIVRSILAPGRLRGMACTKVLQSLHLIPTVSLAAHIHRNDPKEDTNIVKFNCPNGSIFVGLDTCIKTGLPVLINAPVFLHERNGNVMLEKDDDKNLRQQYPSIRNVKVKAKSGNDFETCEVALYLWNREAILSASALIPQLFNDIRDSVQNNFYREPKQLYCFWPYFNRIRKPFRDLVPRAIYEELGHENNAIFLTKGGTYTGINEGCFASTKYPIPGGAAQYFQRHLKMFTVPQKVIEDLQYFDIRVNHLTPRLARSLLKEQIQQTTKLKNNPQDLLELLFYCIADVADADNIETDESLLSKCKIELNGLRLMPMADGSVGCIGKELIVASQEQQDMFPLLKYKFISPFAIDKLQLFLDKPGFLNLLSITSFGPKIIAEQIETVLPDTWKGKDFVPWCPTASTCNNPKRSGPSQLWLYKFWKEINIWDSDVMQQFSKWPLIPTQSGELASCGNLKYILSFYPKGGDKNLHDELENNYKLSRKSYEDAAKSALLAEAAERRAAELKSENHNYDSSKDQQNSDFFDLGMDDDHSNNDMDDKQLVDKSNEEAKCEDIKQKGSTQENVHDVENDVSVPAEVNVRNESNNLTTATYTSTNDQTLSSNDKHFISSLNSSSIKSLHMILCKLRCPVLEMSYFRQEDIEKIVPPDRLSLSRCVLVTLNQCINYWTRISSLSGPSIDPRLQWFSLKPDEMDLLATLIAFDHGQRLSLMPSDLALLGKLPIFETMSHERVSLTDRDEHFLLGSSVDINDLNMYLPESLKNKFLVEKTDIKDLLKDLNVKPMNEAQILQEFVLPHFIGLPFLQKELVCETILSKWSSLRESREFLDILRETPFVKRTRNDTGGEIEYVKPIQLFDPRNEFLYTIFDGSQNKFPTGEFRGEKWLTALSEIGLNNRVDKDVFLQCAWKVESQKNVDKALMLHKYYAEHFGEFYDSTQEFSKKFADIQCVPAEKDDGCLQLCKFRETAAPRDRNLIFKVLPVIPDSIAPPQVMFSSLGIQSPPAIPSVLKHLRLLTKDEGDMYQWNHKHGKIEDVFANIFSYLQENFSRISPAVQTGLRERSIVPVGSTLVKASKLFFRLKKDLAPFFYEVPRAFGAYDKLLRDLGVRDNPSTGDYAVSLQELEHEIQNGQLNANELHSVVEVLNLIADDISSKNSFDMHSISIFAPDTNGSLVRITSLVQNDRSWLFNADRLDRSQIRTVHPKISNELCHTLNIRPLSERVIEKLDTSCELDVLAFHDSSLKKIQSTLQSDAFERSFSQLIQKKRLSVKELNLVLVRKLRTRFIFSSVTGSEDHDITKDSFGTFCFIDGNQVYVSRENLPSGLKEELVIAIGLCDYYFIDRKNAAAISAMLVSDDASIKIIERALGAGKMNEEKEYRRGEPGTPVSETDLKLIELRPLKVFREGEIIVLKDEKSPGDMVYGVVIEGGGGTKLSRLRIRCGKNKELILLSSEIFSLRGGSKVEQGNAGMSPNTDFTSVRVGDGLVKSVDESNLNDSISFSNSTDVNIRKNLCPVNRDELLSAIQDLLKSSDLSLEDGVENIIALNLKLREESIQRKAQVESIQKEGKDLAQHLSKGMDTFLCPITRELMKDPVICADGHTYERNAIEEWLRSNSRSPKTNQRLFSRDLIPNHALRSAIEGMQSAMSAVKNFSDSHK